MPSLSRPPGPDAPAIVQLGWALRCRREAMPCRRELLAERLAYSVDVVKGVENGTYAARIDRYMGRWVEVFGLDDELRALWARVRDERAATWSDQGRTTNRGRRARGEGQAGAALAARAYAGLGDAKRCGELLQSAWQSMSEADRLPRRSGIDFFDVPRLKGLEGTCLLLLKQPRGAQPVLAEVLALRDPAD